MARAEELALLRVVVDVDSEDSDAEQIAQRLENEGRLDGFALTLAAALNVGLRRQFPERYRASDVIRLVADLRCLGDETGDEFDPWAMEWVARSALGEPEMTKLVKMTLGGKDIFEVQLHLCGFLAADERLGDVDTFLSDVDHLLDVWTARPRQEGDEPHGVY